MNMKGVSPVVATVLLIAIAVIAAVGVWYWVGAYTSKPATTGTDMKIIQVSGCIAGATTSAMLVRNLGSAPITTTTQFAVYNSSATIVGNFNVTATVSSLGTSAETLRAASTLQVGTYRASATGFQDVIFTCS